MYCVKCGVELADSEKKCPLCGTAVFHPELARPDGQPPFPAERPIMPENVNRSGLMFVVTMLFALPIVIALLCDWQINGRIVWSGYAAGAVLLLYVLAVLPLWFRAPNPVIFIPVDFAAAALYLIITAAAALLRYLHKGYLFIFGGTLILSGAYMVLVEFLINMSFHLHERFIWSFYPLAACLLLGMTLIIIGLCRPLRESLHRKFFI